MSLPRAVRAVVFDMDGLLVDTEVVFLEAQILAARARGLEMPRAVALSTIGRTWPDSAPMLAAHFGTGFDVDAWRAEVKAQYDGIARAAVCLKAGVVELLDHLEAVAVPRAVATSSSHKSVERSLGGHGLLARFDAIVAHGDYQRGKPHPDPYLKAAQVLGVEPRDCLALEDSHNGVRAAAAAGMMTVMVPDLLEATDEMSGLCVGIARDLHEVRGLMLSLYSVENCIQFE